MQSNAASLSNASDVRLDETRRTSLSERRMTARSFFFLLFFNYLSLFIWMFARRTSLWGAAFARRTSVKQGQIKN